VSSNLTPSATSIFFNRKNSDLAFSCPTTHIPTHDLKWTVADDEAWRTWTCGELDKAAAGADAADVSVTLQLVLSLEGVECLPK
jgi:hypothetical protein